MKKKVVLPFLVGLVSLCAFTHTASAQTTTLYGRPGTYHPNGDISCADNDRTCAVIKDEIMTPYRTTASASPAQPSEQRTINVTAFTANGPVSFDALPNYQVTSKGKSSKTYHFKKVGPTKRVVYTN